MIHYTCDRCHRGIDSDSEVRYSVEIEMKAVFECKQFSDSCMHDDADHLLELHEMLERLDEDQPKMPQDPTCSKSHFDLCSDCFKVYSRNPMAREVPVSIQFSEN